MPESVEVLLMANALYKILYNKRIVKFGTIDGKYVTKMPKKITDLSNALPLYCCNIGNLGKLLWFEFTTDINLNNNGEKWYIFNNLGLYGGWVQKHNKDEKTEKQNSVILTYIDDDNKEKSVYYRDSIYAMFRILNSKTDQKEITKILNSRGVDVCKTEITVHILDKQIKRLRNPVEILVFLMKQEYLSGIGNYLKSEILYVARLSPHKLTSELSLNEKTLLCNAINQVVKESIDNNGRILKYSDLLGDDIPQYKFKVYQKDMDYSGNKVTCEDTCDDRKTYWVPSIQL